MSHISEMSIYLVKVEREREIQPYFKPLLYLVHSGREDKRGKEEGEIYAEWKNIRNREKTAREKRGKGELKEKIKWKGNIKDSGGDVSPDRVYPSSCWANQKPSPLKKTFSLIKSPQQKRGATVKAWRWICQVPCVWKRQTNSRDIVPNTDSPPVCRDLSTGGRSVRCHHLCQQIHGARRQRHALQSGQCHQIPPQPQHCAQRHQTRKPAGEFCMCPYTTWSYNLLQYRLSLLPSFLNEQWTNNTHSGLWLRREMIHSYCPHTSRTLRLQPLSFCAFLHSFSLLSTSLSSPLSSFHCCFSSAFFAPFSTTLTHPFQVRCSDSDFSNVQS